jgi:hypothetical protein
VHPYTSQFAIAKLGSEAGSEPSVARRAADRGSAGANIIGGLRTAEAIHWHALPTSEHAVKFATLDGVAWFNHPRPRAHLGYSHAPEWTRTTACHWLIKPSG